MATELVAEIDFQDPQRLKARVPFIANELPGQVLEVVHSDIDGDEGSVTLFLDGEPLTMTNGSANWTDGTVFSYEWVSTSGPHTYYFYAEDLPGLSFILDNDTNVFEFIIHERMNGVIRGNVRDSARSNVSGAELVIYNTSLSAKNVIVVDRYFNTTTDQNGDYSLELPFCDYKFVIKMNEDWLDDNNYSGAKPSIGNFLIDMTHQEAWMNFTLDRTPVPTRTTVAGIINHSAGNLEEVNIIVEIYADEEGEMDVLMDDVVITVDITWRTWMNLTTRTDENGSYSIAKIPTEAPPLDEEKVTGRKTFRHDQGIPVSSENGWWYVIANRSGHHDEKQLLEFHYGKTTWWNTTLRKIISEPEQFYQITGTLSPPDAAISFSGTQTVEHDTETGEFTISYLTDGLYKLTFSKEGYIRQFRNITVAGSGWELDITLLLEDTDEPKVYQEVIGPFLDGNGDGISGILVSFQLDGILYEETTGTGGKAIFEVHKPLPEETPITAKFEGKERTWNWGDKEPYDAFAEPKGGGESSFMIVLIIVIVVIFGIVVAVLLISRSRGAVEEEEEEMDTGYECPECGTSVSPEMSACPECGQSFDEEEYKCPECGEPVEADATGCGGCGVEFDTGGGEE